MSIKNKNQIYSAITTNLPDNSTNYISAQLLRNTLFDINDSFLNEITDIDKIGLSEWNSGTTYNSGMGVFFNGTIYQANTSGITTTGSFVPAEWDILQLSATSLINYIEKTNGIELLNNKRLLTASTDTTLSNLTTGIYNVTITGATAGLSNDYPIAQNGILVSYSGSSPSNSMQFYYPNNISDRYYIRNLNGSNWIEAYINQNTVYTTGQGLQTFGNQFELGGDFTSVYLNGISGSPIFNVSNANSILFDSSNNITLNSPVINLSGVVSSLSASTIYSGSTNLYDIFLTTNDGNDITRVQPGVNTITGGTDNNPTINITSATLNNLSTSGTNTAYQFSATTISGGTIYSGSTNLYDIFEVGSSSSSPFSANSINGAIMPISGSNVASGNYSFVAGGSGNLASGNLSHSEGYITTSYGSFSHAEGFDSTANNTASHAEGYRTISNSIASHSEGFETIADDLSSHAEGYRTSSFGTASHSEGNLTTALGSFSHAEGDSTTAFGVNSHAEGLSTYATGSTAHAEGNDTLASGNNSHAEGYQTISSGLNSHAEGYRTTAVGLNSHTEGRLTTASGRESHAEGSSTLASGDYSHTEGRQTTASGSWSHAEGRSTIASNARAHAEGYRTTASGNASHAEGTLTIASGNHSHAQGNLSVASGSYSHAGGVSATATGINSIVHSRSSVASANYAVILGGSGNTISSNSHNAFILNSSGSTIQANATNVGIIGGMYNIITANTNNQILIGTTGYTAPNSVHNTVFVSSLAITNPHPVPTSSSDTIGATGTITWDSSYMYIKTESAGWLRSNFNTF